MYHVCTGTYITHQCSEYTCVHCRVEYTSLSQPQPLFPASHESTQSPRYFPARLSKPTYTDETREVRGSEVLALGPTRMYTDVVRLRF